MSKVIAEVSITPIGTFDTSVSSLLAQAIRTLEQQAKNFNLRYQVGPMGTCIEGESDFIWQAIKAMQESVFSAGVKRVVTTIRIDDRRDKPESLERKVASISDKGAKVNHL